jgi:hypothetical protein
MGVILNMFLLVPHFKMETLVCGQQASISWMRTFTSLLLLLSENVFVTSSKRSKTPDLEKAELPFPFGKQEFVDRNP